MHILFLDLASRKPAIALVTESETLNVVQRDEKILEHELLPLVEQILKSSNLSYNDLTHIACTRGPGGFTSVRLGVATANALAYALRIPIVGIPLTDQLSAFSCQELGIYLPELLRSLPYDAPPILPTYGSRPFITLRKNRLTSNEKRTNAAA